MKYAIVVLLCLAFPLAAQSLTVTGGDRGSCTFTKQPSIQNVTLSGGCVAANGEPTWGPSVLSQPHGSAGGKTIQAGDVTCLIAMNASGNPVMLGSMGTVTPGGIVIQCSAYLRDAGGAISGQVWMSANWP